MFSERVTVDTRKQSETFHMRKASTGEEAGDIVYDFQWVIHLDILSSKHNALH